MNSERKREDTFLLDFIRYIIFGKFTRPFLVLNRRKPKIMIYNCDFSIPLVVESSYQKKSHLNKISLFIIINVVMLFKLDKPI